MAYINISEEEIKVLEYWRERLPYVESHIRDLEEVVKLVARARAKWHDDYDPFTITFVQVTLDDISKAKRVLDKEPKEIPLYCDICESIVKESAIDNGVLCHDCAKEIKETIPCSGHFRCEINDLGLLEVCSTHLIELLKTDWVLYGGDQVNDHNRKGTFNVSINYEDIDSVIKKAKIPDPRTR